MVTREGFNQFIEKQCETIKSMLVSKGLEYNKDSDAFSNFYGGTKKSRYQSSPIQVLEGYKLKHDMSIELILGKADNYFWIKEAGTIKENGEKYKVTKEMIDDKFDDEINYWILLKGLLYDIYGYTNE